MFEKSVSDVIHLLMAVHMQGYDFYCSQIEDIIDHYGEETVSKAEKYLYESRAFNLLL